MNEQTTYDRPAARMALQWSVDAIEKDSGNRTLAAKKAATRTAYQDALEAAPSKAEGRRVLGTVSDYYDGLTA